MTRPRHAMTTRIEIDGTHLECSRCGRHVRLEGTALHILEPGDRTAQHRVGFALLSSIEDQPATRTPLYRETVH